MAKQSRKAVSRRSESSQKNVTMIVIGLFLLMFFVVIGMNLANRQQPGSNVSVATSTQVDQLVGKVNRLQLTAQQEPLNKEAQLGLANTEYDVGAFYLFNLQQQQEGTSWFKRAITSYQKALLLDSQNVGPRVDMATAAFYAGEYELAQENFKQAIAQDPTYVNARFNYGIFLLQAIHDYQEAIAQFEEVLKLQVDKNTLDATRQFLEQAKKLAAK